LLKLTDMFPASAPSRKKPPIATVVTIRMLCFSALAT
jgi:hypothetical protein